MNYRTPVRLKPECISCLIKKQLEYFPEDADEKDKIQYMQKVLKIGANARRDMSAPVIVRKIYDIQKQMFGMEKDYTEIKKYYNKLMLEKAVSIEKEMEVSEDPIKYAVQCSMMGNYIDFGAMENVDEYKLGELLKGAKDIVVNEEEVSNLEKEIENASCMVYLTDNCGEIVMDKLLIQAIQKKNPNLKITVIVRGGPVQNDATMVDASQVGLTDIVDVINNGSDIAGTDLENISEEALRTIEEADFVISKGQGNFETLQQCGLNIYYIFMCKCDMFARKFQVPKFTGMLINDRRYE